MAQRRGWIHTLGTCTTHPVSTRHTEYHEQLPKKAHCDMGGNSTRKASGGRLDRMARKRFFMLAESVATKTTVHHRGTQEEGMATQ